MAGGGMSHCNGHDWTLGLSRHTAVNSNKMLGSSRDVRHRCSRRPNLSIQSKQMTSLGKRHAAELSSLESQEHHRGSLCASPARRVQLLPKQCCVDKSPVWAQRTLWRRINERCRCATAGLSPVTVAPEGRSRMPRAQTWTLPGYLMADSQLRSRSAMAQRNWTGARRRRRKLVHLLDESVGVKQRHGICEVSQHRNPMFQYAVARVVQHRTTDADFRGYESLH